MTTIDTTADGKSDGGWKPIATAPDSEWLLCCWDGHGHGVAAKVLGKWMAPGARALTEPSAWMHLPPLPDLSKPLPRTP